MAGCYRNDRPDAPECALLDIAESFRHQQSSQQIRLLQDAEYNVKLDSSPNGYFSFASQMHFQSALENVLRRGFKANLRKYFGFDVSRQRDGTLLGKHLMFDKEFRVPDYSSQKMPLDKLREFNDMSPNTCEALIGNFFDFFDNRNEAYKTVVVALWSMSEDVNRRIIEFRDVLNAAKFDDGEGNHSLASGKFVSVPIIDRAGSHVLALRCLLLRDPASFGQFVLPTPETMVELRELGGQAREFRPKAVPKHQFALPASGATLSLGDAFASLTAITKSPATALGSGKLQFRI